MDDLKTLLQQSAALSGLGYDGKELTQQEHEQLKADFYNASEGDMHESDGYDCRLCRNKGYISHVVKNEMYGYFCEQLSPCKCWKVRSAINKLARSGLKNAVKAYTFDKYETPDAWQQYIKDTAMRFCQDQQNHWFYIGGQSGAGKTHICTAIAVHYIRQGMEARYMLWRDEIVRIKALVNDQAEYTKIMQDLKTVPVLYIDDLFKTGESHDKQARPTTGDINAAFEIINHRYANPGLVTIISSEKTLPELLEIDEATAGRIAERSKAGGYCVNLKKDSKRNWRLRGLDEV
jgi:DNA replication protein DnaC